MDFVCKTPKVDIEYYQVTWQMPNENTIEPEFGSLEKINDNNPKFLLTTDSFTQDRGGMRHLNVFTWLLDLDKNKNNHWKNECSTSSFKISKILKS